MRKRPGCCALVPAYTGAWILWQRRNARNRRLAVSEVACFGATRFFTHESGAELIDFMPVSPPTPDQPKRRTVIRRVTALRGETTLRMDCRPAFNFARDAIHHEIMEQGWSPELEAFTQAYGSETLDASNLMMPLVFFLSPTDPRLLSTLDAMMQAAAARRPAVERPRLSLPRRAVPGRSRRGRGDLQHLHVLAREGVGASRSFRRPAARGVTTAVRAHARLRESRRSLCRGNRTSPRSARQLPAGVHPSRSDQRSLRPRSGAREQGGSGVTGRSMSTSPRR